MSINEKSIVGESFEDLSRPICVHDGVIRNVKRRARGFRDMDHFAAMIYLTCGRLDLKAVTTT
ncbi:hypothetical protein [Bifidobacterium longum]|uniref:hypothetical protein n=1 Tax=Bifidobacterium longum TaxID=216816 RepID=UPI003D00B68E